MYILSTTFVVDPSVHEGWYAYFASDFLPTLSGRHVVFCRVLSNQSDAHYTYSLQVDVVDIEDYQKFEREVIERCVEFCHQKFGERVLHFSTLLKKIER